MKYLLTMIGAGRRDGRRGPGGDQAAARRLGAVHAGGDRQRRVPGRRGAAAGRDRDHRPRRAGTAVRARSRTARSRRRKEVLGGFYLLECADLDEALEWAKKMPVTARGRRGAAGHGLRGRRLRATPRRRRPRLLDGPLIRSSTACSGTSRDGRSPRLIRVLGDFDLAEEAVQEAFVVALERWPARRRPGQPGRVDHPRGAQQGDRPPAPRAHARAKQEMLEGLERLAPDAEEIDGEARGRRSRTTACA